MFLFKHTITFLETYDPGQKLLNINQPLLSLKKKEIILEGQYSYSGIKTIIQYLAK